ncbi:hypothetical protein [Oscillibacter sp.]|uniref:hypothetical protein n=1 Tax=Oscillibacter sp. TaxID=1945593 RepID=UPI0028995B6A|nr:hypothetical protein [Oscillibacter sp.]
MQNIFAPRPSFFFSRGHWADLANFTPILRFPLSFFPGAGYTDLNIKHGFRRAFKMKEVKDEKGNFPVAGCDDSHVFDHAQLRR